MNRLFELAAQNTLIALVLALLVYGLTRLWRNPPLAHVLWLLVLLKLVAPPVLRIDWPLLSPAAALRSPDKAMHDTAHGEDGSSHEFSQVADPVSVDSVWKATKPILFGLWVGGTILSTLVIATRIVRFERELQDTLPASARLQQVALEISGRLGIRRVPNVRIVDSIDVPMLWCAGLRPTIVLPIRLLNEFDHRQLDMILAHELAHLRRRDHWVRGVELLVSVVYWWNPLAWLIRRQIHRAEDLCCDAWVRWIFPECASQYAEVVFKTAESLTASRVGLRILPASPFLHSYSLKARIQMILESRFAPNVTTRAWLAALLVAAIVWPISIQTTTTQARADFNDEVPASKNQTSDASATSAFPYKVDFEQGATRFSEGDDITIVEIRGTADTITAGNIYWIKGNYTLASHKRAMLAAYTTAMDVENGTSSTLKVQTTTVDQGQGTFTLFLPMTCRGWPHVSFYPADHGSSFGGNYFGTGDSVLKRWWD